jgi:hypothetical protein
MSSELSIETHVTWNKTELNFLGGLHHSHKQFQLEESMLCQRAKANAGAPLMLAEVRWG